MITGIGYNNSYCNNYCIVCLIWLFIYPQRWFFRLKKGCRAGKMGTCERMFKRRIIMLQFLSIEQFKTEWQAESDSTRKIFGTLTDDSLGQATADNFRTLGRMAWHIVQSVSEMSNRMGLEVTGPGEKDAVPESAGKIRQAYDKTAASLLEEVSSKWEDAILEQEDDMYGQKWTRGLTLCILLKHEIHHRGQMTVLMRQAGLTLPGIYGPAKEEWSQYGMPEPEI